MLAACFQEDSGGAWEKTAEAVKGGGKARMLAKGEDGWGGQKKAAELGKELWGKWCCGSCLGVKVDVSRRCDGMREDREKLGVWSGHKHVSIDEKRTRRLDEADERRWKRTLCLRLRLGLWGRFLVGGEKSVFSRQRRRQDGAHVQDCVRISDEPIGVDFVAMERVVGFGYQ